MTTARAKRELIGHIDCPVCEAAGAEVRVDSNGRAYVVGDCCVSLTRSSSRAGSEAIRRRMKPCELLHKDAPPAPLAGSAAAGETKGPDAAPPPAPKKEKESAAAPGFLDALTILTGGRA